MEATRLKELYNKQLRSELKKDLGLSNIMEVPRLEKVVLNVGVRDAVSDAKSLQAVVDVVKKVSGQAPIKTKARKSIAAFKLREGMPIGVKVTLRGNRMYEFVDRLVSLALPKMRDFQGITRKLDGRGNYNLGIKEWTLFPEVDFDEAKSLKQGLNITFHTSAKTDDQALALLKGLGLPFKKDK